MRVSIRNLAALPLRGLALVIEYADTQGQLVGIVPIVGAAENSSSRFHVPFPFQRVATAWQEVPPGGSVALQGTSDGILTPGYPSKATITFAIMQAADGPIQEFASRGWHLDPTPRVIPFVPVFPRERAHPPIALLVRVRINAFGQVTAVVAADNSDPRLIGILEEKMRDDLRFNPGLYDGQPVPSEVLALFRIHAERSLDFPNDTRPSSPVVVIDLFPDPRNLGKLEVAYGGLFSGATVE